MAGNCPEQQAEKATAQQLVVIHRALQVAPQALQICPPNVICIINCPLKANIANGNMAVKRKKDSYTNTTYMADDPTSPTLYFMIIYRVRENHLTIEI